MIPPLPCSPTKANRLVTPRHSSFLLGRSFIVTTNLCASFHSLFDLARVVYHSFVDVLLCLCLTVTVYVCLEIVSLLMM